MIFDMLADSVIEPVAELAEATFLALLFTQLLSTPITYYWEMKKISVRNDAFSFFFLSWPYRPLFTYRLLPRAAFNEYFAFGLNIHLTYPGLV
jgi:hypothetical protein